MVPAPVPQVWATFEKVAAERGLSRLKHCGGGADQPWLTQTEAARAPPQPGDRRVCQFDERTGIMLSIYKSVDAAWRANFLPGRWTSADPILDVVDDMGCSGGWRWVYQDTLHAYCALCARRPVTTCL